MKTCQQCSKEFKPKRASKGLYCSQVCSGLARKKHDQSKEEYEANGKKLVCKTHGLQHHVVVQNRYRCSKCCYESVKIHRYKLKAKAIAYKGGKCQECGYNKSSAALEFHHRDPSKKDFTIATKHGWATIQSELDKCDLLCANCHRELHAGLNVD